MEMSGKYVIEGERLTGDVARDLLAITNYYNIIMPLNGYDDQERNLTFVKTEFQV